MTRNTLILSPSHPPLWRIDLPTVEKILKIVTISTSFIANSEHTHMIALVSCQASSLLGIGNLANGRGQFPVTKQEMATNFAAREILVLATEDDCSGQSNSENREGIDGASMLIAERPGLARKAWKTSEPFWEKPFQDRDLVASLLTEGSLGFQGF